MLLSQYRPKSQLTIKTTLVVKPYSQVIDIHNHLGENLGGGWCNRPVEELLDVLDQADTRIIVGLDGGWGEHILHQRLDKYKNNAPDRFCFFGGVDWTRWSDHGNKFGEWAAERLKKQAKRGAQGLKIWKQFGISVQDQNNKLVSVDDKRLDSLWAIAGELGLPVMIHVADPIAFFDPVDETNERWEELQSHPEWQFSNPGHPQFQTIISQFTRLIARHPNTNFIGAHVGGYAENLNCVSHLLDIFPNLYVDISARISELGRQPYSSRRFLTKYADRVLFGLDMPPSPKWYRHYYRFLESDDEYFNYDLKEIPSQGRWMIYGVYLPGEVLEKIYYQNALKLLPDL